MLELTTAKRQPGPGEFGPDESLPACFERVLPAHASRIALLGGAWRPTYQELNATANRLAHAFLRRGGAPGDRIAVLMQSDAELTATLLAVLKAGRILVVLNAAHPPERLRQVIQDAEPHWLVTDSAGRDLAAAIAGPDCGLVDFERESRLGPDHNPSVAIDPEQTAFLVYTSGSGGAPKGVMQTHRQYTHIVTLQTQAMGFTTGDRLPLFGSLSHGHAIGMTLAALLNGATLCAFPMALKGVTGLGEWMVDNKITAYVSSASIFRSFMKSLDDDVTFPSVRAVRLSSEPASSSDFKEFRKHFREGCRFVHTLMSSETAFIAIASWSRDDKVPQGRLPIGHITKGHDVLLLDERGVAVGPGEIGEIVVRSRSLAAGYWRNPALTVERFCEDGDGSGIRTFRTGDLGRVNPDGMLEFCGRRDTRVKIRGNRIELSEVADALQRLPGIEQAAVEVIDRPNHEPALVGYVAAGRNSWSSARLRRSLRAILPDYMIPSTFVVLDSLPLTSNGKIDRESLRLISLRLGGQQSSQQPKTETESLLVDIWAEVFELPGIGRNDDFFALGGDSLMAALVAAQVHAALGIELNLGMFADHPTLAELARVVDQLRQAGPDKTPPLVRAPRDRPLPLSWSQERTWRFSQTPQESARYTVARVQRIVGPLNAELLRDCMSYIARRHEILRTTYALIDGQPAQVVHPPTPVSLPLLDLTGTADPEQQAVLHCRREAGWIFDPAHGPLMRFLLIRLRENEHLLLRVLHHIACDSWTWTLYFRELALLYEASVRGKSPPLPESALLQYGDYAVWQRQLLDGEGRAYKEAIAWWKAALAGAPSALKPPFMRAERQEGADAAEGVMLWGIRPGTSRRLDDLARREGATPYMVRLAAFVALLAEETRQADVVLGTYMNNRHRLAVQDMFGNFANLVTLRFEHKPANAFREWLDAVRTTVTETEARSEIPYEQLRHELEQNGTALPEIQVIFGMSAIGDEIKFAHLQWTSLDRYFGAMPWGISITHYEHDEERSCRAAFDAGLYDPAAVRTFIKRYTRLLDLVSRRPDLAINTLLAKSLHWRQRLRSSWIGRTLLAANASASG